MGLLMDITRKTSIGMWQNVLIQAVGGQQWEMLSTMILVLTIVLVFLQHQILLHPKMKRVLMRFNSHPTPQNTQKEVSSSEENTEEISPPISKEKEESTEIDGSNHSILGKNNESQNELKEDFDSVSEENNNTSSEIIDEQHANLVDSSIEEETESSWNDSNPGPGFILLLPAYIGYRIYKKKK